MQMRVFAIPMDGDDEATEELNRFLRGQKVRSVEAVPESVSFLRRCCGLG